MHARNSQRRRGFTLIEIMITVAIIGILSSMAIPAFSKYVRRSRTTEALMNLRKMHDSSVAYFSTARIRRTGENVARQFPGRGVANNPRIPITPGPPFCADGRSQGGKWTPNDALWSHDGWQALNFAMSDPHYFSYVYVSEGTLATSSFTARAHGDMNCDGTEGTFERIGRSDEALNVVGGGGVFTSNPLE